MASFILGIIISLTSLALLSAIYIPYFMIAAKYPKLQTGYGDTYLKRGKLLVGYVLAMYGIAFVVGFFGALRFAKFFVLGGFVVGVVGGLWGLIYLLIRDADPEE